MTETRLETVTRWGKVPAWWLLHDGIDADRFGILAALATYADDAGLCDPSQATLARRLKRSRPWVNRIIAQLAEEGFLEKTGRARRNGGTTSCLYRLRLNPPSSPVPVETCDVAVEDTPCHQADRNQPIAEQNQNSPPSARKAAAATDRHPGEVLAEVPAGWEPSDKEMAEALRLCPSADLDAHTVRFRARCRAKGYRYRLSAVGEAWLAWLIEDHCGAAARRTQPRQTTVRTRTQQQSTLPSDRADQRFAAWAAAATLPTAAWS